MAYEFSSFWTGLASQGTALSNWGSGLLFSCCRLVEEFMLLANMAVAHQIYRSFPEQALLRRHPPPQTKLLKDLMEFCNQVGLNIDFSSAGSLHVSALGWQGVGLWW